MLRMAVLMWRAAGNLLISIRILLALRWSRTVTDLFLSAEDCGEKGGEGEEGGGEGGREKSINL